MVIFFSILGGVLLFLVMLTLIIAYVTYHMAFHSPDKIQDDIYNIPTDEQYMQNRDSMYEMVRTLANIPYESVSIVNRDGMRLVGKYYHVKDGAPLDIGFHGYRGTAIRDFCGGTKISFSMGHNVLLIDQRAHGGSDGHTIAFGVKERFDCLDWINYANERFGKDTPILLYGVSMGGATVLMASGLELPPNVYGIVADSPYSSPEKIIKKVCRDRGYPPSLAYPFLSLGARLFGRICPEDATAADAARKATVPMLIIHGEDDRFVPDRMSEEVRAANPVLVSRHTFPTAGHGLSYIVDFPRYERLIREFIEHYLP